MICTIFTSSRPDIPLLHPGMLIKQINEQKQKLKEIKINKQKKKYLQNKKKIK